MTDYSGRPRRHYELLVIHRSLDGHLRITLRWDLARPWWGRKDFIDFFGMHNTAWSFGPFYISRVTSEAA